MADVIILTENAPKIAVGEEDRSRTVISDQRGLLPKMGKGAGDHELGRSFAVSHLSIQAINLTFPWAKPTLFKEFL